MKTNSPKISKCLKLKQTDLKSPIDLKESHLKKKT